ncbi:MAG: helix-turn-helix domain-containing protein [Thermoplasmata archaeon]
MPADLDYFVILNPEITDVLFHIIISFVLALIVNVKVKHKYWLYLGAAIGINGFIDSDHLISIYFGNVNIFHNMFVFVIIPLAIYGIAFAYGALKRNPIFPVIALMIFAITLSHMYLDVAAGTPILLQYPFSTNKFIFNPSLSVNSGYVVIRTQEMALLLLGIIAFAFNRVAAYHYSHAWTDEEGRKEGVIVAWALRKVCDREMARILYLLAMKPLAPHEITAITGIPLAEVYRRLKILLHLGIVAVKDVRYNHGGRVYFLGTVPGRVYVKNREIYLITS